MTDLQGNLTPKKQLNTWWGSTQPPLNNIQRPFMMRNSSTQMTSNVKVPFFTWLTEKEMKPLKLALAVPSPFAQAKPGSVHNIHSQKCLSVEPSLE